MIDGTAAQAPTITTDRLSLRPLGPADVEALVELDADPEVRRHVDQPDAPSREDVIARMPDLLARYGDAQEPAFRAALLRADSTFCGWFHLRPLDGDPASLDLGYRLSRRVWGRGYASEGAAALVRRAFEVLSAARVVAHALEANTGSRRVLEKVGLRERARYLHRDALPAVAYLLTREQYFRGRSAAGSRP